jgi:hypothetical protein
MKSERIKNIVETFFEWCVVVLGVQILVMVGVEVNTLSILYHLEENIDEGTHRK